MASPSERHGAAPRAAPGRVGSFAELSTDLAVLSLVNFASLGAPLPATLAAITIQADVRPVPRVGAPNFSKAPTRGTGWVENHDF